MAVVQNPFLSTNARGSTSGLTASFSRGGITMRRKSKPSVHRRGGVPTMRSIMGWVSRQWAKLSDAQRAEWTAYAISHPGTDRFGDPFIMSGINAFMMLNHKSIRRWGNANYQTTPPAADPPASCQILTAVTGAMNAGEIDLTWVQIGAGLDTDVWEIWMAGPFQSPGRVSVNNRFSFKVFIAGDTLLTTVSDLAEGFWYWFQIRYLDTTGQITAWVLDQATPKLTV